MASQQYFLLNINDVVQHSSKLPAVEAKPHVPREKVISYEEKSVGSTQFFKCEACPYMAFAEDDIKFHLFTEHPDLAKTNGLADNIQINCPGCTSTFDAEETLRTHLRNHHKMGIKDVKKMVKSLVQIALKNAKLKREEPTEDPPPNLVDQQDDVKIPQVIEIIPDEPSSKSETLPNGVVFISVDELQKMSTPNFEQIDPKEIIQEASINIVYANDVSTQYINVSEPSASSTNCNVIQVPNVTPDLISSVQPKVTTENTNHQFVFTNASHNTKPARRKKEALPSPRNINYSKKNIDEINLELIGKSCSVKECRFRMQDEEKLAYHRRCHQSSNFQCLECQMMYVTVEMLHTHLWKIHAIDMELPTCEICGYKTYKKHRLYNIHMRCHDNGKKKKAYHCIQCQKSFKTSPQLAKHRLIHKKLAIPLQCNICKREFQSESKLKAHNAEVHDKLRTIKCLYCEYTSARKVDLELHQRSHTGEKPYSCDACSFQCADHNSMRRHKKQHTKEHLYQCKYCSFSAIQSATFTSHVISKHPDLSSNDVHRCPYCVFRSVSREKYVTHLTTHSDQEGIQLLLEMNSNKTVKPSWTIPSETDRPNSADVKQSSEKSLSPKPSDVPIEVYDCDSQLDSLNYENSNTPSKDTENTDYSNQVQDLSKQDDNNSDCVISESSNDTLIERQQFPPQHHMQNIVYLNNQQPIRLIKPVQQNLLQNNGITQHSPMPNHSPIMGNHTYIHRAHDHIPLPSDGEEGDQNRGVQGNELTNNIMSNFPIRIPPVHQSLMNNFTLKPIDKIPLPMNKVTGPIIRPTQILPVPSSSNSPVNSCMETEGAPRKKPKISVKSNLVLKGPDQVNMFHSQQKLAFERLEDNERFGLGPVTFNNLITTQFMQLPPEPALSESPSDHIMSYPQETLLEDADAVTTPVDSDLNNTPQIFSFNQQLGVNPIPLLPPQQKTQNNDPSYIKLESTIKQNTQSPSLERMCNANSLLSSPAIAREYKASPPLEDLNKNLNEIKNEVKSDSFYNLAMNNVPTNPAMMDQYLLDNIIGEQYAGHLDLSTNAVIQSINEEQQDVIEIDDNSDDTKLLPRFDMNFPLESLYLMHNDFHFLDNEVSSSNETPVEMNRITEVPIINQNDTITEGNSHDFPNFIQGKKDPVLNTSVRPATNKINVKNIELMKK